MVKKSCYFVLDLKLYCPQAHGIQILLYIPFVCVKIFMQFLYLENGHSYCMALSIVFLKDHAN